MTPRYLRFLMWAAILYLLCYLLVCAVSFLRTPSQVVYVTVRDVYGVAFTPDAFGLGCLISALQVPLQLTGVARHLSCTIRRIWYFGSLFPIAIYAVPVIIYSYRVGTLGIGTTSLLAILVGVVLIGEAAIQPNI